MTDNKKRHMTDENSGGAELPGQQIASLSDRLAHRPPNRRIDDQTNPSAASDEPTVRKTVPSKPPTSAGATRSRARRPEAAQNTTRNVALSLEIKTRNVLRKRAREVDTSQAEVIYRALERYVANGEKPTIPESDPSELFQRRATTQAGSKSVHTVRLPVRNLEIVDDLVDQTGHLNRSALLQSALDLYLEVTSE